MAEQYLADIAYLIDYQQRVMSRADSSSSLEHVSTQLALLQEQVKIETQVTDLEVAHFLNPQLLTLLSMADGGLEL